MDDGSWGYPEDFESGPSEPLDGNLPNAGEIVMTQWTHGFSGDRGGGAMIRQIVLDPSDPLYLDLLRHNMVR